MNSDPREHSRLTIETIRHVDDICTVFETQWRGPERPAIEDFLSGSHEIERSALLRELLAIELEHRLLAGEAPQPGEYVERFPLDLDLVHLTFQEAAELASPEQRAIYEGPAGAARDEPITQRLPRRFGDYELLEEIARGGMGVVYKARQLSLDRMVAVKMILAGQFASPGEVERFYAEAQAAAQFDHPNIVQVIEVGELEGQRYFSMSYVQGVSLAQQIAIAPLPPNKAAQMLLAVAEAVQYAHQRGIVHRDLKPANILLDVDGRPRITDFGLAKRANIDGSLTITGQIIGTPGFMPPEQASGKGDEVGKTSDVYSLGAVLYAMLTGRPPFQAANALDTLKQVLEQEPIPPRRLDATTPRDLETLTLKCLEKKPARRYDTAQALADELRRFLLGKPITARPVTPFERLARWCRRKPGVAALVGVVIALLTALAIGGAVANGTLRASLARAETAEIEATANLAQLQVADGEKTEQLWRSLVAQAHAGRMTRQPGQRFESLDALREAARIARQLNMPPERIEEIRDEVAACAALADVRRLRTWNNHTTATWSVGVDPSVQRYATCDSSGIVTIRSMEDDTELARLLHPPNFVDANGRPTGGVPYAAPMFSPNGRFLSVFYGEPAHVYDLNYPDHAPTCVFEFFTRFSPSGESVYTINSKQELTQSAPGVGIVLHRTPLPVPRTRISDFSIHPDGKRAALADRGEKCIQLIELRSGKALDRIALPFGPWTICWHPDGRLMSIGGEYHSALYDMNTGRVTALLQGHQGPVVWTKYSQSGKLLATNSWDDTTRLWDGNDGHELLHFRGAFLGLDEQRGRLATQEGATISLYELAVGGLCRALPGNALGVAFAPSGRLLAVAGYDGVHLWDVPTARRAGTLPIGGTETAVFRPTTGDQLVTFSQAGPGLQRWPVTQVEAQAGDKQDPETRSLQIGPPTKLPTLNAIHFREAAWSLDGRRLLAGNHQQSEILIFDDQQATPTRVIKGFNPTTVAISPDGHWGAASGGRGDVVRVWNLDEESPPQAISAESDAHPITFSPDGKWLVINDDNGQAYRFFHVGNWAPGPTIPRRHRLGRSRPATFSADGRLLAVVDAEDELLLLDAVTLKKLITLHTPNARIIYATAFNVQGTLLAVGCQSYGAHVWDLSALREMLASLGIDWNHPTVSPVLAPAIDHVEVLAGDPEAAKTPPPAAALGRPWSRKASARILKSDSPNNPPAVDLQPPSQPDSPMKQPD